MLSVDEVNASITGNFSVSYYNRYNKIVKYKKTAQIAPGGCVSVVGTLAVSVHRGSA